MDGVYNLCKNRNSCFFKNQVRPQESRVEQKVVIRLADSILNKCLRTISGIPKLSSSKYNSGKVYAEHLPVEQQLSSSPKNRTRCNRPLKTMLSGVNNNKKNIILTDPQGYEMTFPSHTHEGRYGHERYVLSKEPFEEKEEGSPQSNINSNFDSDISSGASHFELGERSSPNQSPSYSSRLPSPSYSSRLPSIRYSDLIKNKKNIECNYQEIKNFITEGSLFKMSEERRQRSCNEKSRLIWKEALTEADKERLLSYKRELTDLEHLLLERIKKAETMQNSPMKNETTAFRNSFSQIPFSEQSSLRWVQSMKSQSLSENPILNAYSLILGMGEEVKVIQEMVTQ